MEVVKGILLINIPSPKRSKEFGIIVDNKIINLGSDYDDAIVQIFEMFPDREKKMSRYFFCDGELTEAEEINGRSFEVVFATSSPAAVAILYKKGRLQ